MCFLSIQVYSFWIFSNDGNVIGVLDEPKAWRSWRRFKYLSLMMWWREMWSSTALWPLIFHLPHCGFILIKSLRFYTWLISQSYHYKTWPVVMQYKSPYFQSPSFFSNFLKVILIIFCFLGVFLRWEETKHKKWKKLIFHDRMCLIISLPALYFGNIIFNEKDGNTATNLLHCKVPLTTISWWLVNYPFLIEILLFIKVIRVGFTAFLENSVVGLLISIWLRRQYLIVMAHPKVVLTSMQHSFSTVLEC